MPPSSRLPAGPADHRGTAAIDSRSFHISTSNAGEQPWRAFEAAGTRRLQSCQAREGDAEVRAMKGLELLLPDLPPVGSR